MRYRIKVGLLGFMGWLGVALSGPSAGSDPAPQAPANSDSRQVYPGTGVIKELKPDGKTALIAHEAIPGYMDAMTMPFPVKDPKELAHLKPGDKVTFSLVVTGTDGWIEKVARVNAPPPPAPLEDTFHLSSQVEPLNVGDMVPDYHFTNELGQAVSLGQFRGKAVALTFFFTRCPFPIYCPRLSNHFQAVEQKLLAMRNGPKNWHLLSLSFDTRHDTPDVLQAYAKNYQANPRHWSFLTAKLTEIEALGEHFGQVFWRDGESYSHNMRTVVLDPQGRVQRVLVGNAWTPEELLTELVKGASQKLAR